MSSAAQLLSPSTRPVTRFTMYVLRFHSSATFIGPRHLANAVSLQLPLGCFRICLATAV